MRVFIRLFLFPFRVRPVSNSDPRSDISAPEFVTGYYPIRSESERKIWNRIWYDQNPIRSDPFTPLRGRQYGRGDGGYNIEKATARLQWAHWSVRRDWLVTQAGPTTTVAYFTRRNHYFCSPSTKAFVCARKCKPARAAQFYAAKQSATANK